MRGGTCKRLTRNLPHGAQCTADSGLLAAKVNDLSHALEEMKKEVGLNWKVFQCLGTALQVATPLSEQEQHVREAVQTAQKEVEQLHTKLRVCSELLPAGAGRPCWVH